MNRREGYALTPYRADGRQGTEERWHLPSIDSPLEKILSAGRCPNQDTRAKQVFEARLHHGYTQKAIADHLGFHYATVRRIIQKAEKQALR